MTSVSWFDWQLIFQVIEKICTLLVLNSFVKIYLLKVQMILCQTYFGH